MKIMQVIPNLGIGGAEIMCETLSKALSVQGATVCVVSLDTVETPITRRLAEAGVRLEFLGKQPGLDLRIVPKLRSLLRSFQPDAIHCHIHALKYAALADLGLHIPLLRTVHSLAQIDVEADQLVNTFLFSHRLAVPVSLSKAIQQSVADFYRIPADWSPIVLNGVDLTRCTPKTDYSLSEPPRIVHIGRLEDVKNHDCMLQAAALLRQKGVLFRMDFWGQGALRPALEAQAQELGLSDRVFFRGLSENVYPILSGSDLFMLPSKWEGIPMSIIEAMGTGLPIVAARVGGVPDLLRDGETGLLIDPTPEALAAAIERLLSDDVLRSRLGTAALHVSKNFSAEAMATAYTALYQKGAKHGKHSI